MAGRPRPGTSPIAARSPAPAPARCSASAFFWRKAGQIVNRTASAAKASISGGQNGVRIDSAPGTVTNFGAITGGYGGGTVVNGAANDTTASILGKGAGAYTAGEGVQIANGAGTVTNFGTISISANGYQRGVELDDGGTVTSKASALISGDEAGFGILVRGVAGTVANYGTITSKYPGNLFGPPNPATVGPFISARYGTGVALSGSIINGASGASTALIIGGFAGVSVAGTVINFGTIAGGSYGIGLALLAMNFMMASPLPPGAGGHGRRGSPTG